MQRPEVVVATSQGVPGASGSWDRQGRILPLWPSEGAWPSQPLACRRVASRTAREDISIVLSHLVCGALSSRGWYPNTLFHATSPGRETEQTNLELTAYVRIFNCFTELRIRMFTCERKKVWKVLSPNPTDYYGDTYSIIVRAGTNSDHPALLLPCTLIIITLLAS